MAKRRSYGKKKRTHWGLILLSSLLVAASICITVNEKLQLGLGIPGWNELLAMAHLTTPASDPNAQATVHVIDVGQAECVLIKAGGKNVLLDAGEYDGAGEVLAYLKKEGVQRLDAVIATHPHADHIGGMASVIQEIPIDRFLMGPVPDAILPTTATYTRMLQALKEKNVPTELTSPGVRIDLGGAVLAILGPVEEFDDLNNTSVVCRLEVGNQSVLLCGDMEKKAEKALLESGAPVRADVLITGHHGSKTSSSPAFLQAVRPALAAISVGEDNSYGLPDEEVLDRLEQAGTKLYRTDLDGTVVFTIKDGEIKTGTEKAA